MSTIDAAAPQPNMLRRLLRLPSPGEPLVPKNSVAGRALVAVVAIMTFLSSLTVGALMLVWSSAREWQAAVAREVTIQVRPVEGRDIEHEVGRAAAIARSFPGVVTAQPYSREQAARLIEPWLGASILDELPLPRLIVVRIAPGRAPDLAQLRQELAAQVAGASLDDHRAWMQRMRALANIALVGGVGVLALMLAATVLSVVFATRGAMASNRPTVEVLHFIGATDGFIAGQFQRRFLMLGLEGGALGGGMAVLLFVLADLLSGGIVRAASHDQFTLLFGGFSLGISGYLAVAAQIVLIALATALTSRRTVCHMLKTIE